MTNLTYSDVCDAAVTSGRITAADFEAWVDDIVAEARDDGYWAGFDSAMDAR